MSIAGNSAVSQNRRTILFVRRPKVAGPGTPAERASANVLALFSRVSVTSASSLATISPASSRLVLCRATDDGDGNALPAKATNHAQTVWSAPPEDRMEVGPGTPVESAGWDIAPNGETAETGPTGAMIDSISRPFDTLVG